MKTTKSIAAALFVALLTSCTSVTALRLTPSEAEWVARIMQEPLSRDIAADRVDLVWTRVQWWVGMHAPSTNQVESSNVIRTHKLNIYSPAYVVDMRPNNDGSGVLTVRCRADAEQIPKKGLNFKRRCDLNAHLLMHYAVTGEEEPNPSMIWIGETSS
ncbi:MAG: hypothetical protein COX57_02130 [Alphaproteobacteria bacterium CG_4_10_14_0_2_um_filter_63_37]|nr:MAG: hypothetical protein AUJ55_06710 [Proteobacteria bacterium CG1_02_64_396]PJA25661.1 MAG: hypothetical protein COX57_02130 [Alphaproteobacteria bacterium CG_4_10_14_0_2_um_filter_63_37]